MSNDDPEFTGLALRDLVIAIEMQVGRYKAGATPLGRAIVGLCEDAMHKDRAHNLLSERNR